MAGAVICSFVGKQIAKKVIGEWRFIKSALIFTIPFSLLLVYVFFTKKLENAQIVIFAFNFVGS